MGTDNQPLCCYSLTTVFLQSSSNNMAKVICLLAWAGLAIASPQRTILLGGRDGLNTESVVDTILAQLDTPINNAIQAALSGLYTSSKSVSSSPVETSFTSVVSQAPAITVQTSGTFSSAEDSEGNIEGQFNGFSTSEGDSTSFTSNTVSEDSAAFFSSSQSSSQDSNSFFSSSSSGSLEDSYVPVTTFTDSSSSSSGSGFNSGSSSSSSSSSSSDSSSSSLVSQVVGELGPQIDEAVRAAMAALKTTTTAVETPEPEPAPAPTPVTSVTSVTSVVEEQSQSESESESQSALVQKNHPGY